jgi:uncharacterized RDD family membrane protein YckC
MHSAEPFDPRSVTPAPDPEAWRAEIASRLNSYRARRKKGVESLALDFESAAEAMGEDGGISGNPVTSAAPREAEEAHDAFDTNYYRRLNARAMEETAAATAHTASVEIAEAELEPDYDFSGEAITADASAASLSFDLDLHAPAPGNARLDRYSIHGQAHDEEPIAQPKTEYAGISCEPTFEEAAVPPAAPAAASQLESNLIVFPRPLLEPPLMPPPSRDELAEPVHARPRILEVPEDIIPAVQGSLFPEIRLDGDETELSEARVAGFELPLQVAPVAVRVTAALADLAVVMAAVGIFVAIADRALPDVPHAKPYWMGMGVVAVLFWAIYQAMFLLYAGRTLGMSMNRIHLSTFGGRTPQWEERRRRAAFTIVSFVSVALGFLWALVDEDTLCWHDRVSQTFPTVD